MSVEVSFTLILVGYILGRIHEKMRWVEKYVSINKIRKWRESRTDIDDDGEPIIRDEDVLE